MMFRWDSMLLAAALAALGCGSMSPGGVDPVTTSSTALTGSTTESSGEPVDALVFAAPESTGIPSWSVEHVQLADVDADGILDVVHTVSDDGSLAWHQGLGDGTFVEMDATGLDSAVTSLSLAAREAVGLEGLGSPFYPRPRPPHQLTAADGNKLVLSFGFDGGSAVGVLQPDDSGEWTGTLLAADPNHVIGLPVADLDGDGAAEVLLDHDGELVMVWGGDPERSEVLGSLRYGSIYPQAWAGDIDADGDDELLFFVNPAYGVGEAWMWSAETGLIEVETPHSAHKAWASAPIGSRASQFGLATRGKASWLEPGDLPAMRHIEGGDLEESAHFTGGNFDGSGGLTLLSEDNWALRYVAGAFEQIPLEGAQTGWHTLVGDLDGDGLDDLVDGGRDGSLAWQLNISR